jgi:hypothetical protein
MLQSWTSQPHGYSSMTTDFRLFERFFFVSLTHFADYLCKNAQGPNPLHVSAIGILNASDAVPELAFLYLRSFSKRPS